MPVEHEMKTASAFSPGHITGFFQICDEPEDVMLRGSKGAGVSVSKGAHTNVSVEPAARNIIKIAINNTQTREAAVSEHVTKSMLKLAGAHHRVTISHKIDTPIGVGLGSSGAGSLSLALALNEALDLQLTREQAAQHAHTAEVVCRTGLGTVIAEMYGGMEIRTRAGAPGIGEIKKIPLKGEYTVAYLPFGSISTRRILSDKFFRARINELGGSFVDQLLLDPRPPRLMRLSRDFAEHVGLLTERVRATLKDADAAGFTASMPMFGEAAFSLVKRDEAEDLAGIFRRHESTSPLASELGQQPSTIILTDVDEKGARLL